MLDKNEIGKRIRFVLIQQDKKLNDLAKFIGISSGCLSNKIYGRNEWKLNEVEGVCKFLEKSSKEIFGVDF